MSLIKYEVATEVALLQICMKMISEGITGILVTGISHRQKNVGRQV